MTLTLATTLRQDRLTTTVGDIDGGSAAGKLEIRSGTRPAGPDSPATGTLLATVTLQQPSFTISGGTATLADPDPVTAVADGEATWFRIYDGDNTPLMDGKVGTSGADLNLATTALTTGLSVDITGGTLTEPAGTAD